jgi:hypothetical protein
MLFLQSPVAQKIFQFTCTQHNVEQYFKHSVCQYVGEEGAATNSHFTSLQWVNYHIEAQKGTKLIMSPAIHDAIRRQQTYHKNAAKEKYQNVILTKVFVI